MTLSHETLLLSMRKDQARSLTFYNECGLDGLDSVYLLIFLWFCRENSVKQDKEAGQSDKLSEQSSNSVPFHTKENSKVIQLSVIHMSIMSLENKQQKGIHVFMAYDSIINKFNLRK